jgi:hypothetical protein
MAFATLLLGSAAAQAVLTVYTSEASFLAAITDEATDSFDDLSAGANLGNGPLSRSAGAYSYEVSAGPSSPDLYGAGSAHDTWLSTNRGSSTVTFTNFGAGVYAAGGYFFNSNVAGKFLPRGMVTVTATDVNGTVTQTKFEPTTSNYFGFVSDTTLLSLTVSSSAFSPNMRAWPTIDDLTLAGAVPEPQTYAMFLAGLGVLGFLARRRRNR